MLPTNSPTRWTNAFVCCVLPPSIHSFTWNVKLDTGGSRAVYYVPLCQLTEMRARMKVKVQMENYNFSMRHTILFFTSEMVYIFFSHLRIRTHWTDFHRNRNKSKANGLGRRGKWQEKNFWLRFTCGQRFLSCVVPYQLPSTSAVPMLPLHARNSTQFIWWPRFCPLARSHRGLIHQCET